MYTGRYCFYLTMAVTWGTNLVAPLIAIASTNIRLEGWRFSPDYQQLDFVLSAPTQPNVFYLQEPARLVVDLPNTKLGMVATRQDYSGLVQRVRVSQLNATDTRIVMDLAPGSPFNPAQVQVQALSTTQWSIRPFTNTQFNPPGNSQSQLLQTQPVGNQPGYSPSPQLNTLPPGVYPPSPPINYPGNNPGGGYPNLPGGMVQPINPNNPNFPNPNDNFSNQSPPTVVVPPINPINNNPGGFPNNPLPPPSFPNQTGNWPNPPLITPNPRIYQQNQPSQQNQILEWGQQLPPVSQ